MPYIDYRKRLELGQREYESIDRYCKERSILWFASCWDEPAVDFIEAFDPPCYKAASASLTDLPLLRKMRSTGKPLIASTGMSTMEDIERAVATAGEADLLLANASSTHRCPTDQPKLRMIQP